MVLRKPHDEVFFLTVFYCKMTLNVKLDLFTVYSGYKETTVNQLTAFTVAFLHSLTVKIFFYSGCSVINSCSALNKVCNGL